MLETPHERHHHRTRFEKLFVIFQKAADEAGPPCALVKASSNCESFTEHSQRDTSGGMYLSIPGQGLTYPPEVLVLLINNKRSLIYTKHQTFTQLHLAEVNLAACWDLKIIDINTELMASRMWFSLFQPCSMCLALKGLPVPRSNQTALLHWVNLAGNSASTPICDKQLNFTFFECQIRENLSIMTYLDWWVHIGSESVSKKPHSKTIPRTTNQNKRSPKVKTGLKIAFNTVVCVLESFS